MNQKQRDLVEELVERWKDEPGCEWCGETETCHPACPSLLCGECAGTGMVINLDEFIGITGRNNPVFEGKACPRGCTLP